MVNIIDYKMPVLYSELQDSLSYLALQMIARAIEIPKKNPSTLSIKIHDRRTKFSCQLKIAKTKLTFGPYIITLILKSLR
jgi:hypothetical protein